MGSPDAKSKYVLDLDGRWRCPRRQVAVAKEFQVRSAVDANDQDLIKFKSAHAIASYKANTYNAVHNHVAMVSVPKLELTRDVTKIAKMSVETDLVFANNRVEANMPAVVME